MKKAKKLFSFSLFFLLMSSSHADLASFEEPKRLLLLDGTDGTVACRIYGSLMSGTFPRFSDHWVLESATRSLLRMRNLTAVRGPLGASMVGPADYLGNLEEPHQYLYIIKNQFPPLFYREPITENVQDMNVPTKELDPAVIATIKTSWISGKESDIIWEKEREYNVTDRQRQQSLFLDPGLLEVDRQQIELSYFDPRGVDLSSFKARLVNNQTPFQITKKPPPPKDDYRLVTYLYEPLYAAWQVEQGSGLFLEKHKFSQTITPITPDAKGFARSFVVLGEL